MRYCNCLVEAEYDGVKAYGWLPLYELQNAVLPGSGSIRSGCGSNAAADWCAP